MATVQDVLNRARSQIGVHGGPPDGDRTPYSEWYGIIDEWCGMFVSWCFYHEGLPLGPHPKGFSFTPEGASWFRQRGRWTNTPRPGYVVFFDWPGHHDRIEHVGIVESVRPDGSVITIEGNTRNSEVARRSRSSSIVGYGIPDYAGASDTADWFARASAADLEAVVRKALNEGTAYGQRGWAGTSKAGLGTAQGIVNILRGRVIPKLPT